MIARLSIVDAYIENKNILKYILLLLWGVAISIFFSNYFFAAGIEADVYMPTRVEMVVKMYNQLCGNEPVSLVTGNYHGQVYYIFLAYLMHFFDLPNAETAFLLIQGIMCIVLLLAFPFCIYYLTKSYKKSIISEILLLIFGYSLFWEKNDSAWAGFMVVIIVIPLMLGICQNVIWKKREYYIFVLIAVIIALFNIPRAQSAFSLMVILAILLFQQIIFQLKEKKIISASFLFLILLLFLYISNDTDSLFLKAYNFLGGKLFVEFMEQPWHSAYIGLGYLENSYGIYYSDICAEEFVKSIDADCVYLSKEYFEILKKEYLSILKADPIFAFKGYLIKFIVCMRMLVISAGGWWACLSLGFYLLCYKLRGLKKIYPVVVICLMCVIFGSIQGVLAIPRFPYISSSVGTIAFLNIYIYIYLMEYVYKKYERRGSLK